MNASQKVAQYLGEAKASEDALVRVLQSQIAMTPAGSYRSGLETHLEETRNHSQRVARRIGELSGGRNPFQAMVDLTEGVVGQTLALSKMPLDLLRGTGGEEKVLKNAKDAAATEALEIATYAAIERLAQSVDDEDTLELAQSIRGDEERMLERIMREIPGLTDAVVRADLHGDPSYDLARTGAADAVREAEQQVADSAKKASGASRRTARQARTVPGVAQAEGQARSAVAGEDDLAISGYDNLTADEITTKLPGLSQIDLAKIDSYERRHDNRATVLGRVETLRGEEPWPGYDELKATEVQSVLAESDDDRIAQVRSYERSHKSRAGVLKAASRQHSNK
jgi:ferritin-like metal-binding protein YciE